MDDYDDDEGYGEFVLTHTDEVKPRRKRVGARRRPTEEPIDLQGGHIVLPAGLAAVAMLPTLSAAGQRLAWSLISATLVEKRMTGGFDVPLNLISLLSGQRVDSPQKVLDKLADEAVIRSDDPTLDGVKMFRSLTYQRGRQYEVSGRVRVDHAPEIADLMLAERGLARVPADTFRWVGSRFGMTMLVGQTARIALKRRVTEQKIPDVVVVTPADYERYGVKAKHPSIFLRDHVKPALNDLCDPRLVPHLNFAAEVRDVVVRFAAVPATLLFEGLKGNEPKRSEAEAKALRQMLGRDLMALPRAARFRAGEAARKALAEERHKLEVRERLFEQRKAETEKELQRQRDQIMKGLKLLDQKR